MAINKDFLQQLLKTIDVDIKLSKDILPLLASERSKIEEHDIVALEDLSKQKIDIYEQLHNNQLHRDKLQELLAVRPGFSGLKELLAQLPTESPEYQLLDPTLQELQSLLHEVNIQNVTNAKTVALSYQQIDHVLNFMFGKDNSSECYGKNAQILTDNSSNTVSKA